MSISPIITFKAGICDVDTTSTTLKVTPKPTPGYLYLFEEDELMHFCWRPRPASLSSPELELIMVPGDGRFIPYECSEPDSNPKSPTNGRVFVLKFQSSSIRHLFWLQSKSQHAQGDPAWFSPRDLKMGQIVDRLLQGDEVNVQEEIANVNDNQGGHDREDDRMEDVRPGGGDVQENIASGDPFMGNPEEEGEGPREGGADGGRAADIPSSGAAAAIQNFLRSMQGNQALTNPQAQAQSKPFITLPDLLPTSTTIPIVESMPPKSIDSLLSYLPPTLLLLNQEADDISSVDLKPETAAAALEALSLDQKKDILKKVLRSPQFSQSLGSLTQALRDGGLPSISDALGVKVENGGFARKGEMPIGGGEAVEAFLKGVRGSVEEKEHENEGEKMQTD